jgi:hypothetical protein
MAGSMTNFTALQVAADSTCTVTATFDFMGTPITDDTGLLTVQAPRPDYVMIVDAAGGAGTEVMDRTYMVYGEDFFYLAGYNSTLSAYVGDYEASAIWSSNDTTVGQIQTVSMPPRFYAQKVTQTSTCFITATYSGMSDDTGTLTVLKPEIDYIQIRTAQNGGGNILDTVTYNVDDTDDFWVAGYNFTADFVEDLSTATWAVTGGIGDVSPQTGSTTTFTATTAGTGTITATYGTLTNASGTITVELVVVDVPPARPGQPTLVSKEKDEVTISWPANTEPDLHHYVIQRSSSSAGPWTNVSSTTDNTTTSFTDTGLESGTTYYYRIVAVDDAGLASDPSPEFPVTTTKPKADDEAPWLLLLLFIIIVIVILLLLLFLWKRKKGEEEAPPAAAPPGVAPPPEEAPPAPMEEVPPSEVPEEGMPEEGMPEEYPAEEYPTEEPATPYEEYEEGPVEEGPSYEETPGEEGTDFEEMTFEEEPTQQAPPPPPGSQEPTEFGEEPETPPEKKKLPPPPP